MTGLGSLLEGRGLGALVDRLGALHLLRLGLGAIAVLAVAAAPGATGDAADPVVPVTAAYLLVIGVAELGRRIGHVQGTLLGVGLLFADGLWLAMVREVTGGPASVLSALVVMHLVAVMLVASVRTGLRVALWHASLYLVAYAIDLSWGRDPRAEALDMTAAEASVFAVGAFLLLAVGTAVFSAVNERELRRSRADMAALADLAVALDRAGSAEAIEGEAVMRAVRDLGYRRAALITRRPESLLAVDDAAPVIGGRSDDALWGIDSDVRAVDRLPAPLDEAFSASLPDAHNVVIVPLRAEAHRIGVLVVEVGGGLGAVVPRHRLDLARQFASHVALALHRSWLHAEVERLANEDQLTGLANRRVFDRVLERETARALRSRQPLSVLLIDADHFKQVNDQHGHQVGDHVLRELGAILGAETRTVDLAARYGGEELVVVLPGADEAEAAVAAERLRRAIAEHADMPVPVTVSIGVASHPVHAGDAKGLVEAADRALYAAKAGGRNRCEVASEAAVPLRRVVGR